MSKPPYSDAAIEYEIGETDLYKEKPVLEVLTPTGKKPRNNRMATNFWCKHCGPGN